MHRLFAAALMIAALGPLHGCVADAPPDVAAEGAGELVFDADAKTLTHVAPSAGRTRSVRIPLWCSLLPPLVAIGAAFLLREVIVALSLGVLTGAVLVGGVRYDDPYWFFKSLLSALDTHFLNAVTDGGHMSVILFSLLVAGVVQVTIRNGGMRGVADRIARIATTPRRSQLATWLFGLFVFFDDYANSLIVGQTMRPLSDRRRVSREKLAYLVDSTAAPIAATAFVSTWIGAELGYIQDGLDNLDGTGGLTPYGVFMASLKYCGYTLVTLAFTLTVLLSGRDFGPMLKAERRARGGDVRGVSDVEPTADAAEIAGAMDRPATSWLNAAVPVAVLIVVTVLGLLETAFASLAAEAEATTAWLGHWVVGWNQIDANIGEGRGVLAKVGHLLGRADSYAALMWSSLTALVVAIGMSVIGRSLSLVKAVDAALEGFKVMLPTLLVLSLAWTLASVIGELKAAEFLTGALGDWMPAAVLPAAVFVLSAATAYVTGSSWSTMAIIYPLAIPLTWAVGGGSEELLFNVVAVTLSGSVLGDHCSPISDTTILSSMATECDHLAHVKTQTPYALLVGGAAVASALLTASLALPTWGVLSVQVGAYAIAAGVFFAVSRRIEA